jgi:hypothetical protein
MSQITVRDLLIVLVILGLAVAGPLLILQFVGLPPGAAQVALKGFLLFAPFGIVAGPVLFFSMQRLKNSQLPWPVQFLLATVLYALIIAASFGYLALLGWPKL